MYICGSSLKLFFDVNSILANAYDFKQLNNSIRRIKSMDINKIYPGHGEPFLATEIM